jgi:hypothetical protein
MTANGDNPQKGQGITKITLAQVLQETSVPAAKEVSPLTRIGYKLALFLLLYLSVVTAILLAEYFLNAPSLPKNASLDAAQLGQYQQLSQIATERTVKLLDALVLKGFLPVFTAILGYIFGSNGADRDNA